MGFRFVSSACVAVGTFNIYIVQPRWLTEIGILDQNVPVSLEADLNRPGFRFMQDTTFQWEVRPDRLTIKSMVSSAHCGNVMAGVLEKLRFTPLTAVGCNYEYASEAEFKGRLNPAFEIDGIAEPLVLKQRTMHFSVDDHDRMYNVQVSRKDNESSVLLNVHTTLSGHLQERAIEMAIGACRDFSISRATAEGLATQNGIHFDD